MSNVYGYSYGQAPSYGSYPQQPAPLSANPNGSYNVNFNINPDQYKGQAASIVEKAAPFVPGAVAGHVAKQGMRSGMRIAKSGSRARARARGYGGRYSSKSPTRRTTASRSTNSMFSGVVSAIKYSTLVGGIMSIFTNGGKLMRGEQDMKQTATNVAGDVTVAAAGGAAGAVASAVGTPILASMFGPMSMFVTLGGIGLGIGGYMLAENWIRKTPFFQKVTGSVQAMFA